jgi:hypothetical protein
MRFAHTYEGGLYFAVAALLMQPESFDAAIASTFCEAAISALDGDALTEDELYSSLLTNVSQAIVDRLWNAGWIFAAADSVGTSKTAIRAASV